MQVYAYYSLDPSIQFDKIWFQFAKNSKQEGREVSNLFYGFPAVPWGPPNVCYVAVDDAINVIADPKDRKHSVISPKDLDNTREWIGKHIRGVGPDPLPVFAGTCLQTNVSDNMFVLDFVPERYTGSAPAKSIIVFTAGWAMKFTPLLGHALKELLLDGKSQYDVSQFAIDRSHKGKPIIRDGPVDQENIVQDGKESSLRRMGH